MTDTATLGTIEHIDPSTLVIEDNVRSSAPLTKEFVASIRENGVLTPVLARRDANGTVIVRAGQRRTLGAREAGRPTIPVYVVDADEQTAERIIEQMVENDHREALSTADRIAGFQQLAFEGLSIATVAKRTGAKRDDVKAAIAVSASPAAVEAVEAVASTGLTLDQAAELIEFEDHPEVWEELVQYAVDDPGYFPHALQRARDDRARSAVRAAKMAEYAEAGWEVLDDRPGYDDPSLTPLRSLANDEGRIDLDALTGLDGRAVHVVEHDPEQVVFCLRDAAEHGLSDSRSASEKAAQSGPMTEEQKAERKTLIANNKAWDAAEKVRREWVAGLLSRKTLPKDTLAYVARAVLTNRYPIGEAVSHGSNEAQRLLQLIPDGGYNRIEHLAGYLDASPTKSTHLILAVVLGGIESSLDRWAWRNPTAEKASYLRQLGAWGYSLSPVEKIAAQIEADADSEREVEVEQPTDVASTEPED